MTSLLAEVVLPCKNGIAADAVVNTLAFSTEHTTPADAITDLQPTVIDVYNHANTSHALSYYIGPDRDRGSNLSLIKWYNIGGHLDGSAHGSPISTGTFTLGASVDTNEPMPDNVAVCVSFHGAYGTDPEESGATRPRSRERGRVFIGPLNWSASIDEDGTTYQPVVKSAFRTDLTVAFNRLRTDVAAISTPSYWAVWSRTAAKLTAVTGGFVDNVFDTQRRRNPRATARTTFGS